MKPKLSSSVIETNAHLDGDVVLLNIDSKYFASSSQPKNTPMVSIKLENLDSDSEHEIENHKNLELPVNT